jgi:hypothetical protein
MSADKRYTTIQFRRGNNAEFSGKVLASGEPAFAIDTSTLKIGDGSTTWASLSGLVGGAGGGISSISQDGAPILGGDLNLDTHAIAIDCKNETGSTINIGTPVYVSGYFSANGKASIAPAIANDPSKMPAIGLLTSSLDSGDEGAVDIFGVASQLNTNSFDVGDTVYVDPTGGLTDIRPTGLNELVQNMGRVLRKDSSQGKIIVLGPGRTNDVPNSGTYAALQVGGDDVVISSTGIAGGGASVNNIVQISQEDFDGLSSVDSNTIYFIS